MNINYKKYKLWTLTTRNRNYEHWLQEIETMNTDYKK